MITTTGISNRVEQQQAAPGRLAFRIEFVEIAARGNQPVPFREMIEGDHLLAVISIVGFFHQ
jgi:hypothetical protein